jgi:hypothetical protein
MYGSGRWAAYLRRGQFVEGLIDEAIAKCLAAGLLRKKDDGLVKDARSIVRAIIRREKGPEKRWWETDPKTGKKIRRSKALPSPIVHPIPHPEEAGEYISPLDTAQSGADGRPVGTSNVNLTEQDLVEQIETSILQGRVIAAIGLENWQWALEFTERQGEGKPVSAHDYKRFQTLKDRVQKLVA